MFSCQNDRTCPLDDNHEGVCAGDRWQNSAGQVGDALGRGDE